jgi:hypothetical protein
MFDHAAYMENIRVIAQHIVRLVCALYRMEQVHLRNIQLPHNMYADENTYSNRSSDSP